jgi:hypothetical protein
MSFAQSGLADKREHSAKHLDIEKCDQMGCRISLQSESGAFDVKTSVGVKEDVSLTEETTAISLAPLGLPGEAFKRAAALAHIDTLEADDTYIQSVDVFARISSGAIEYLYESWAYKDIELRYAKNLPEGSAQARKYIKEFSHHTVGELLFQFQTRKLGSVTSSPLWQTGAQ